MFAENLKKNRLNCGFTQRQVAEAINLDRSTYSYYELGKTSPDLNTLAKLVRIFNITYNELLESSEMKKHRTRIKENTDSESIDLKTSAQLTKDEKLLLSYFRLLPSEEKKNTINKLSKYVESLCLNFV